MLEDEAADRLFEQGNVEALHRYLIVGGIGWCHRRSAVTSTAVEVLRHYHGEGQPGAVDTALLVCTDHRWERRTGDVVRQLADCGVIDDGGLHELADRLLWPDRICFVHPWIWFGSTELVVPLDARRGTARVRQVRVPANTTVPTPRLDTPPLRRWAAARVLADRPERLDDVLARAASLDALRGAGVTVGVLEVLDRLPTEHVERLLDHGLRYGHKSVRRAALEWLVANGEHERVWELGRDDPDASIRRWVAHCREGLQAETDQDGLFSA
jgi:hypothetical protein